MIDLIIDNDFLTDEHKKFIDEYILGQSFPWYFNPWTAVAGDNNWFFLHVVLKRPELCTVGENRVNSDDSDFFADVFNTFCNNNKIKYSKILRVCVNQCLPNGHSESLIHLDHAYPHKQLLVYLTDNPKSTLNIYDEKVLPDKRETVMRSQVDEKTLLHSITAEKFKGVSFGALPHSNTLPVEGEGRRVVIVYTYE